MIRNHQRYRQTDGRTDVKRSHDRYIAKACSGKKYATNVADRIIWRLCVSHLSTLSTVIVGFVQFTQEICSKLTCNYCLLVRYIVTYLLKIWTVCIMHTIKLTIPAESQHEQRHKSHQSSASFHQHNRTLSSVSATSSRPFAVTYSLLMDLQTKQQLLLWTFQKTVNRDSGGSREQGGPCPSQATQMVITNDWLECRASKYWDCSGTAETFHLKCSEMSSQLLILEKIPTFFRALPGLHWGWGSLQCSPKPGAEGLNATPQEPFPSKNLYLPWNFGLVRPSLKNF